MYDDGVGMKECVNDGNLCAKETARDMQRVCARNIGREKEGILRGWYKERE